MATKKASKKAASRKSPAKKSPTKKSPAKKAPAKKAPAKKSATKTTATKKSAAKKTASRKSTGRKFRPGVGKQVQTEMHEMHQGELKSGRSGKKVTNPKQAIAIALSEARKKGEKVPPNPNK